jgi:hypothetical protein
MEEDDGRKLSGSNTHDFECCIIGLLLEKRREETGRRKIR